MAQGDSAWMVRTNTGIQDVFRNLLGTDELVCSMDAIGFSTDYEVPTYRKWLHTDQHTELPGGEWTSIQSIFYAEDVPEDSEGIYACTVVVPGSHRYNNDFPGGQSHFCPVSKHSEYYEQAVRLRIKAGQLLVFSSNLVHQGWQGKHRLCYMVSYGKKSDRSEEERGRKVLMYLCGHRSNHWSQYGQLHGLKCLNSNLNWPVIKPTLRAGGDLLNWGPFEQDLYYAGMDWFEEDMCNYIPEERLELL
jgi:hypothetical protein